MGAPIPAEKRVGQRFARLTAVRPAYEESRDKWLFDCDCGNTHVAFWQNVSRGLCRSCGCLRQEWIADRSKQAKKLLFEYRVWTGLTTRCYNPRSQAYKNYGARGVKICEAWRNNFPQFLKDMGRAPEGMSLDRIDCNGDYTPENCRWATEIEQANNKRNNRLVTHAGQTMSVGAWERTLGLRKGSLYRPIVKRGRNLADVFQESP